MGKTDGDGSETVWSERREAWVPRKEDLRGPYACDLERVLQSRSFRSLQGKTQVLSPDRRGLHRTRLTHSLEVAQIGVEVLHQVAGDIERRDSNGDLFACLRHLPPADLVRTIALAHDIGHPPFGHDGETALNACMAPFGGFEANGHTLRVLTRLETSSRDAGSNLTRRALLGVLKYPAPACRLRAGATTPAKGYFDCEQDVVDWILAPLSQRDRDLFTIVATPAGQVPRTVHRSLDCSIMDAADDIAYGVHDAEDGLTLGMIDEAAFRLHVPLDVCVEHLDRLGHGYIQNGGVPGYERLVTMLFGDPGDRRRALSRITSTLVIAASLEAIDGFEAPILRYRVTLPIHARRFLDALHRLVRETMIRGPEVSRTEQRTREAMTAVFDAEMSNQAAMPPDGASGDAAMVEHTRHACDRIAALTDRGLLERLADHAATFHDGH